MSIILVYADGIHNKLYFVNSAGRLQHLYTPFLVKCIKASGSIRVNTLVYVDAIGSTRLDELIFIIQGVRHYYYCFVLIARF